MATRGNVITEGIARRVMRIQSERKIPTEAAARLGERARVIVESRIRPSVSPHDASLGPENCGEGIAPIIEATIAQAFLDATRDNARRPDVRP